MALEPDIEAVLDRYFPSEAGRPTPPVTAELRRVLTFAGVDPAETDRANRQVVDAVVASLHAGLPGELLLPSAQAYGRGLSRIVAAESDAYRRALSTGPERDRAGRLDRLLAMTTTTNDKLLLALHAAMLRAALEDSLSTESLAEPEQPDRVVSLVDVCQSTPYLSTADREATRHLVDALYEAGRTAEIGRAVWTVKYVGDGVFLVGRDAREVIEASLTAIGVLERSLPLRARAGIARGPVVRRAGDYFGPVVNLAQRMTTIAPPSTVVAAEPAAGALDDGLVVERKEVEVRGFALPVSVAIVEAPR